MELKISPSLNPSPCPPLGGGERGREGKSLRPLWERVWVRGSFV